MKNPITPQQFEEELDTFLKSLAKKYNFDPKTIGIMAAMVFRDKEEGKIENCQGEVHYVDGDRFTSLRRVGAEFLRLKIQALWSN